MRSKDTTTERAPQSPLSAEWEEKDFVNYGGEGRDYRKIWKQYNSVEDCVRIFRTEKLKIESAAVLGAATGDILDFFHSKWGIRPYGCELSTWAYERIPAPYQRRIENQDMRAYLKDFRKQVDLIYANSFMYLNEEDIPPVLKECARITRYLFVDLSYAECFEEHDPLRRTLKPMSWWKENFKQAGFTAYGRHQKLWQTAS